MLVARNIRAWTLSRDSVTLSWDIVDTTEDLATYTVAVLRSGAEVGPYDVISSEMNAADVVEFEDRGVNLHSRWRRVFYRVRFTKGADSQDYGSTPHDLVLQQGKDPGGVTLGALPDLEALEAIRRMDLTLKEYIGRRTLHLARRTWGQYCTDCWDVLKRRQKKSRCLSCFDTGRTGGYYAPQETFIAKVPHTERVSLNRLFELEPNDVVFWVSSRPQLKVRDVLVGVDGVRYRVLAVQRGEKLWSLTRQTVHARALSRDQVEYDIPITGWGVDNFSASPPRQFIRATDIDSYYKAAEDLGVDS